MTAWYNYVIDEFHLIKEWGEEFRFQMLHLGSVIRWLRLKNPHMRVLFLTATLGSGIKEEIEKILQIKKNLIIDPLREIDKKGVESLIQEYRDSENFGIRDNLNIQTWSEGAFWDNLEKKNFSSDKDGPVILYKSYKVEAEKMYKLLKERFPEKSIGIYVGDSDEEMKKRTSKKLKEKISPSPLLLLKL